MSVIGKNKKAKATFAEVMMQPRLQRMCCFNNTKLNGRRSASATAQAFFIFAPSKWNMLIPTISNFL
jgi:hypothetical protein